MLNTIFKTLLLATLIMFSFTSYSEECLKGRLSTLTEDGLKPARFGVPITIKDTRNNKNLATGETDRYGEFCIPYTKIPDGFEVRFEMGDPKSENQQKWSSWVIFSPYQGITYFPKKGYKPMEVIITPAYMYKTFFKSQRVKKKRDQCSINNHTPHVQVASLRFINDAEIIKNSLSADYKTCIVPVIVRGIKRFRVIVFPRKNTSVRKTCKRIKKLYHYKCEARR